MILLPGRFIWLAQPRAGSRSIAAALKALPDSKDLIGTHHAHAAHMSILREYSEPVVSMIRNPYEVVLRRFSIDRHTVGRFRRNPDFKFWFDWWKPDGYTGFGDKIAQYRDYVDHYYAFDFGLYDFFGHVGIPVPQKGIPWIGRHPRDYPAYTLDDLTPQQKQLIDERFMDDINLYKSVVSRDPFILA